VTLLIQLVLLLEIVSFTSRNGDEVNLLVMICLLIIMSNSYGSTVICEQMNKSNPAFR
jgi:hypothetical protein